VKPPWLQARPSRERLGSRLTRAAMGAAALALLVAALIFNSYDHVTRRAALADAALVQARITADGLSAALMFGDVKTATEVLSFLKASPDFVSALARGSDGRVFASFSRKTGDDVRWPSHREGDVLGRGQRSRECAWGFFPISHGAVTPATHTTAP